MTIKTQGGKVLTKDGKVSCECCQLNVCGCDPQITEPLLTVLRNATTGTCNGFDPIYFINENGSFQALFFVEDDENFQYSDYMVTFSGDTQCLSISGVNAFPTEVNQIRAVANEECYICDSTEYYCTIASPFIVNGKELLAINIIYSSIQNPIPPAEFIFS
jgi:hypothetical protein